ncbi:glycosyltransferase family 9 protein [Acidisphaera sp. S103]|uniref:glycosyltransferase family 9 protein n=1 Tax=Acidisphaera sp. S103 TaxID=1747223 RepID=UPI00131E8314|nr:glycosyltransferase family 9 protein [Acidisphaera sp. S103]
MTAISQTAQRAKRVARIYRDMREQTGNPFSALYYVARLITQRLPVAARQARSVARHKADVQKIMDMRTKAGNQMPFLGIKFTGGLGDALVVARFLRDLSAHVGGFDFDIYCSQSGRAQWVFGAVEGLRDCYDDLLFDFTLSDYDLAARVNQFVTFYENSARWTHLRSHPKLVEAACNAIRFRPTIEPFIENHPYMDSYLAQKAVYANRNRADFLHSMVGIPYGGDRLNLPVTAGMAERHGLTPGRYVTIHNGFDPDFFTASGQATKCYPHFGAVVALLRQKRPDLRFVQIGVATSQPLDNVDLNLIDQTSLKEAAGLIGGALLHVDNEGGLVHLARCLGVDSCVVFGPTPSNYFGYAGNVNIDPTFCGGCWWNNKTWMDQCPRGFQTARCMTEQSPQSVAVAIDRHLSGKAASRQAIQDKPRLVRPITGTVWSAEQALPDQADTGHNAKWASHVTTR